jgi:hypothetical protein
MLLQPDSVSVITPSKAVIAIFDIADPCFDFHCRKRVGNFKPIPLIAAMYTTGCRLADAAAEKIGISTMPDPSGRQNLAAGLRS